MRTELGGLITRPAVVVLLVIVLACLSGGTMHAEPPCSGTIHLDPDIIQPSDPTTFQGLSENGRGARWMFDRRVNNWVRLDAYLFDARFSDGSDIQIQVNPEFGDVAAARSEAARYAPIIGQLPRCLRAGVQTVSVHRGNKLFGGVENNVLIHSGHADGYATAGSLEEALVHVAALASLSEEHAEASGWLEAQVLDGEFISTYARDHPKIQDIAESFVTYLALRFGRDRISSSLADTISQTIPNRIAYFDSQELEMSPLLVSPSSSVDGSSRGVGVGTPLWVSAKANVFGAGRQPHQATPNPSGGSGGVPPVVFAFPPHQLRALVFTNVTGSVDFGNPTAPTGPDGGNFSYPIASFNGIAGVHAPMIGFLAGVFLDSNEPTNPAPEGLDFTVIGTDFRTLAPQIGQVFFIGDGKTESGAVQEFVVPPAATRLFLGLADSRYPRSGPGYYHDNTGAFTVSVEALPLAEPSLTLPRSPERSASEAPRSGFATQPLTLAASVPSPTQELRILSYQVYHASPDSIPLPRDTAFGYALPAEVGLSHQIETSDDLIHWSPIGNTVLFFKDLDSTNHAQRFYRFKE